MVFYSNPGRAGRSAVWGCRPHRAPRLAIQIQSWPLQHGWLGKDVGEKGEGIFLYPKPGFYCIRHCHHKNKNEASWALPFLSRLHLLEGQGHRKPSIGHPRPILRQQPDEWWPGTAWKFHGRMKKGNALQLRALPLQNHNVGMPWKPGRGQNEPLQRGQEDAGWEMVGGQDG